MDNISFYGGKQGKDFNIKDIFSNTQDLLTDLNTADSKIGLDEITLISYGYPGSEDAVTNQQIDAARGGEYSDYNSTFWKKVAQIEEGSKFWEVLGPGSTGFYYGLLAWFGGISGETPNLTVNESTEKIRFDATPSITITPHEGSIVEPDIVFRIPTVQAFFVGSQLSAAVTTTVDSSLESWVLNVTTEGGRHLEVGDFYVNSSNLNVFRLTSIASGIYTFTYISQLTAPKVINNLTTAREDVAYSTGVINGIIYQTPDGTEDKKLVSKGYVDSSIQNMAARYLTKDAVGNPFATYAEFNSATTFYYKGGIVSPSDNDYTLVSADESKRTAAGEDPTTRYLYNGNSWNFQYIVNNTGLTAVQYAAINSEITKVLKESYDAHLANTNIHLTSGKVLPSGASANPNSTSIAQVRNIRFVQGSSTVPTVSDGEIVFCYD